MWGHVVIGYMTTIKKYMHICFSLKDLRMRQKAMQEKQRQSVVWAYPLHGFRWNKMSNPRCEAMPGIVRPCTSSCCSKKCIQLNICEHTNICYMLAISLECMSSCSCHHSQMRRFDVHVFLPTPLGWYMLSRNVSRYCADILILPNCQSRVVVHMNILKL